MTPYQTISLIVSMIGVSGILGIIYRGLVKKITETEEKTKAVKSGLQALLRDRLIQSYNYYNGKGCAPIYARENFENMYKQYHVLGGNGVMTEIEERFKALPIEKEM